MSPSADMVSGSELVSVSRQPLCMWMNVGFLVLQHKLFWGLESLNVLKSSALVGSNVLSPVVANNTRQNVVSTFNLCNVSSSVLDTGSLSRQPTRTITNRSVPART